MGKRKPGGNAIGRGEASLREIVRGLDGLIMFNEWEATLAGDLRAKAEADVRKACEVAADGPLPGSQT